VRTSAPVDGLERAGDGVVGVRCGAEVIPCSAAIFAVPWRQAARLLPDIVPVADERFVGSPITAVHLWFDREVIDVPHAVLVGRVSQWVFRAEDGAPGHCQVVISASRGLTDGGRDKLRDAVVAELREIFPRIRAARLVDARVVTDPTAVLSVRPGVEQVRPGPRTPLGNLFLAGDWTATGWPSTMEGAVRSGRIAAEAVGGAIGRPLRALVADLPRSPLVRLLAGPR